MSRTSTPGPSPQFAARHTKYNHPARLSLSKPLPDAPTNTYLRHRPHPHPHHNPHHNPHPHPLHHHHLTLPLPATVYSPEFDEPDRPATPTNISGLFDDSDSDSDADADADSFSCSATTSRAGSPVQNPQLTPSPPSTPMSSTSPKPEWAAQSLLRRPSRKMKAVLGIGMTYPPAPATRSSTPAMASRRPQESHLPVCDNWDATDSDSSSLPPLQLKPWQPLAPKKAPSPAPPPTSSPPTSFPPTSFPPLDLPPRPDSRWSDYSEASSTKRWRKNVLQHLHLPTRRARKEDQQQQQPPQQPQQPQFRNRAMSMVSLALAPEPESRRLKDVFGRLAAGKEERRRRELKRKITVVGAAVEKSVVGYF